MHGVAKARLDSQTKALEDARRRKKIDAYLTAKSIILVKIRQDAYDFDGLQITKKVLEQNPDIYTFWNYRKKTLQKLQEHRPSNETLDKDCVGIKIGSFKELCDGELELTESCLHKNPKSYGAWHHRIWVIKLLGNKNFDFKMELKRCSDLLSIDERNFHCWDYWRSLCKLADVGTDEQWAYCNAKIRANFSNYSAWHCRSTLLPLVYPPSTTAKQSSVSFDLSMLRSELDMLLNAVYTDPEDQSAFLYRDWLLRQVEKNSGSVNLIQMEYACDKFVRLFFDRHVTRDQIQYDLKFSDQSIVKASSFEWTSTDQSRCFNSWQSDNSELIALISNHKVFSILYEDGFIETIDLSNVDSTDNKSVIKWISSRNDELQKGIGSKNAFILDAINEDIVHLRKLVEMEPKGKWPLFSLVLSLKYVESKENASEILAGIEQLKLIDPLRHNYYQEMAKACRMMSE